MWPMAPVWPCLSALERQWLGLPRKSKYVTNSPHYPFVYAFLPSMVYCVVIFLCRFAMFVFLWCLQQNVKSWLNHPLIPLFGCILIGFSLMFSFSSIHLWCFFSLLLRQWLGPHPLVHSYWCVFILCSIVLPFGSAKEHMCFGMFSFRLAQVWTCKCGRWCLSDSPQWRSRGSGQVF